MNIKDPRFTGTVSTSKDLKHLLHQSDKLIHKSQNITMASKAVVDKTRIALNNAYKQLEKTKQYVDKDALTSKGIRRASANIIQRVGRTEPCIDAFQRIFPPEEMGGEIHWSPDATTRNLRTALPYEIRHQTRLYEHKLKQETEGSLGRTTPRFYNVYNARLAQRTVGSSPRRLVDLHQDMAKKAVLHRIEVNNSLIGHLVEAKEEVRRDFSQAGDYCNYYSTYEAAGPEYTLVNNPIHKLDQLDHVVNNINNADILSFIADENANTIFQNTVAAESAKELSPSPYARRRKSISEYPMPTHSKHSDKTAFTPSITPRRNSINSIRDSSIGHTEFLTKKGRTEAFAHSLAKAFESPQRPSAPVTSQAVDLVSPQIGASHMLLSTITDASDNPIATPFCTRQSAQKYPDPDLLAFNYAAQHTKTASERYYAASSHPIRSTSQSDMSSQVIRESFCEQESDNSLVEDKNPAPQEPAEDSEDSAEFLQISLLKSVKSAEVLQNMSNQETLSIKAQTPLISKPPNFASSQHLSVASKKTPSGPKLGEQHHAKAKEIKHLPKKSNKKRVTARKYKTGKATGQHKAKTSAVHTKPKAYNVPNSSKAILDSEESASSALPFSKITVLRNSSTKRSIGNSISVPHVEKKTTQIYNLRGAGAMKSKGTTPANSMKKSTPVLGSITKADTIQRPRSSLNTQTLHSAAAEVLLPTTFSLSSTSGISTTVSHVIGTSSSSPLFSPNMNNRICKTPTEIYDFTEASTRLLTPRENKINLRPQTAETFNKDENGTSLVQNQARHSVTESPSTSQSLSVADRMRSLTTDQRKSRLNSILGHHTNVARASIESINRLSMDMQARMSIDTQCSDHIDMYKDISAISDQESISSSSRRSSVSRQRHATEKLHVITGPKSRRPSINNPTKTEEEAVINDVIVQGNRILRTLQLDLKARRTLAKIREFLLLALIGNSMLDVSSDCASKSKRYNFRQMYTRHRNLTHALDCDALVPDMKIRR